MSTDLSQYRELYLKTSQDLITEMKAQLTQLQATLKNAQAVESFHRAAHS